MRFISHLYFAICRFVKYHFCSLVTVSLCKVLSVGGIFTSVDQTLFYYDFGSQKACSWCNSWWILNRLLIFLLIIWIVFNTATLQTIQNKNKKVSNRFKNHVSCNPFRAPFISPEDSLISPYPRGIQFSSSMPTSYFLIFCHLIWRLLCISESRGHEKLT